MFIRMLEIAKKSNEKDLIKFLEEVLSVYYDYPERFKKMQLRGMKIDNSWEKSAKEYIKAYELAIANKRNYDDMCSL